MNASKSEDPGMVNKILANLRIKIKNVEAFNIIQNYVINNFGSTTSISNMQDDLKKKGISMNRNTIVHPILCFKEFLQFIYSV